MFEPLIVDSGHVEVRTEKGIAHISLNEDGTWAVREDPKRRRFADSEAAVRSVHEILEV
jgi:hypothetical protein